MSSPTKLGEYLAAGLHVISLPGIHAVERLAIEEPNVVEIIKESEIKEGLDNVRIASIVANIRCEDTGLRAQRLASRYYDIKEANRKYSDLYSRILSS